MLGVFELLNFSHLINLQVFYRFEVTYLFGIIFVIDGRKLVCNTDDLASIGKHLPHFTGHDLEKIACTTI